MGIILPSSQSPDNQGFPVREKIGIKRVRLVRLMP